MKSTRRSFISAVGVSAATSAVTAVPTSVSAATAAPAGDASLWRRVKSSFVLDRDFIYMNIGTTGSTPRQVLGSYHQNNHFIARHPSEQFDVDEMRADVAPGFGCDPDEIVLTSNTTDGMCMTLNGIDLGPGDEILTTYHEHPAGTGPMSHQASRRGVVLKELELPVGPDQTTQDYVELFREAITDRTKLICFSHITYLTGTLLPAKEICALAVERGIPTLVDGAHTTGMMNIDLHDIGADFYAASGHKWQCGPGGTGLWYVRNRPNEANPNELPMIWGVLTSDVAVESRYSDDGSPRDIGAFLQSHGNPNYPALRALTDSCDYWQEIGRDRIEERVTGLSAYLKQRLASTFGRESLFAPDNPDLLCALTSFNPFDDPTDEGKVEETVERLRDEHGVIVRSTTFPTPGESTPTYALRFSTHLFHDHKDVDTVADAVTDVVHDIDTD